MIVMMTMISLVMIVDSAAHNFQILHETASLCVFRWKGERVERWSWFRGTDPGVAITATTKQWLLFFFAKMPLVEHTTL